MLSRSPAAVVQGIAVAAAFTTYFCMYAFRKPFSAGTFDGELFGVSQKTVYVIAQIVGYALSKYIGVGALSSLNSARRAPWIVALVGASWFALLGFALFPPILSALMLFANGLCLGMIWGLVVGYLEGRKRSELLLAGLSCSFILASGVVKDVGRALIRSGISETLMPFLTGALFLLPLLAATFLLHHIPPPNKEDEALRSPRSAMSAADRTRFVRAFALPLALLLLSYFLLTAFRDYRDNFGVELFMELGYTEQPTLFSQSEFIVALATLVVLSLLSLVVDNRKAVVLVFLAMGLGLLLVSWAGWAVKNHVISGFTWMICIGIGSYMAYVPFGSVLFDRIIAHTRLAGTAVFGIYLADAVGYTGSVLLQLTSDLTNPGSTRLGFFLGFSQLLVATSLVCFLVAAAKILRFKPQGPVSSTD